MSKAVAKIDKKHQNAVQKVSPPPPALREVNLPTAQGNDAEKNSIITAYKDLNQPLLDLAANQQKNLFIAFAVFVVLGLGIIIGEHFNKTRVVASTDMTKLVPAGAEMTNSEHYHYDKSCYTGDNGEQVCMTRTSQKR